MKRFLLSTVAALAVTGAATAADLPATVAPLPPAMPVPVFTWTGFYVGVHGAWMRPETEVRFRGLRRRFELDEYSFGGGGQVGYLLQFGNVVAGLEADVTVTDSDNNRRFNTNVGGPFTAEGRISSDMDYFGTVKGRLGYSFSSFIPFFQQSMIYVTGGLGYADVNNRVAVQAFRSDVSIGRFRGRSDDTQFGFVVGGGTENAITNNISLKTETIYYSLEDDTVRLRGTGTRARFENEGWRSTIGVNVRF